MEDQKNAEQYPLPQSGQESYSNEHQYNDPDEQRRIALQEHRDAAPKYEELYTTVQENAIAFALSSLAYLKEQGKSADELIQSAGERLIPSWKTLSEQGARVFAQHISLNITALGGQPISIEGNRTHAEVTFKDWIHLEHAKTFGLTREEADMWWNIFKPIADSMHLHYSWQRQGTQIQIKISR
jgi:hypothetical protein